VNGFKDEEFIELAYTSAKSGKRVVIVIEKLSELDHSCALPKTIRQHAMIGMRVKLYSKGSGRWKSQAVKRQSRPDDDRAAGSNQSLERSRTDDMLRLLHFHIGSQLLTSSESRNAMKEAARVYARSFQMKMPVDLLDVGGGMAVDYDVQRRRLIHQANYNRRNSPPTSSTQSKQVCDDETYRIRLSSRNPPLSVRLITPSS